MASLYIRRGQFWQKAFLAAISGCDGGRPDEVVSYAAMVADLAEIEASKALGVKGKNG